MKQTAVEWLIDEHFGGIENCTPDFRFCIQQAKEIEKQRMIDFAFNFYYDFCNKTDVPFNLISENRGNAEQYYNETYESKTKL
jgi:hypothetical protein